MGICCCLLDPQTNSHEAEVLLIERLSSANRSLDRQEGTARILRMNCLNELSGAIVSQKEAVMPVESCIPVIPSANLEKSLRLWVDGLGFSVSSEMREGDKLILCMLRKDRL